MSDLLEQTKLLPAEQVKQELAAKEITDAAIEKLKEYSTLKASAFIDEHGNLVEDKALTKKIGDARKEIKSTRVLIRKTCEELREEAKEYSKAVIAAEKDWTSQLEKVEDYLTEQENIPAQLKKQIEEENEKKQEAIFNSRALQLKELAFVSDFSGNSFMLNEVVIGKVDLKYMNDAGFNEFLTTAKSEHEKVEAKKIADAKAKQEEADRVEKIRLEQESETKRLKAIADEQAKRESEIAAKEKAIKDAEVAAENKRIAEEKEKQRLIDLEKAKAEAVEQARLQAIEDAKIAEQKAIAAKKLAEEKEAKRLARMPDKKLLQEFATYKKFDPPVCKTEDGQEIVNKAQLAFDQLMTILLVEASKL